MPVLPSELDADMLKSPTPPKRTRVGYATIEELADDEVAAVADHLVTAA
jgi:hypothetical protein